jgi:hypothetical protein
LLGCLDLLGGGGVIVHGSRIWVVISDLDRAFLADVRFSAAGNGETVQ